MAARQEIGMFRQRPDMRYRLLEGDPYPIGEPVTGSRADRRRNQDGPERNAGRTDERADGDKDGPSRNEQGDECQRLAKGEREDNRGPPGLMFADELDDVLREIGK